MATVELGQVPQEPQPHRSSREDHGSLLAPGCPQTLQGERQTHHEPARQHPRQSPQDGTASSFRFGLSLAGPPVDVVNPDPGALWGLAGQLAPRGEERQISPKVLDGRGYTRA